MAVYFRTTAASALLAQLDARIEQTAAQGKITTWEKSADGKYYTHKAADWSKRAWFRPKIEKDRLTFNIIKPQNATVSTMVYAYYHGHLIETFLSHFDSDFDDAVATARAVTGDNCSG